MWCYIFSFVKARQKFKEILAINTLVFGIGLILFSHSTYYPLALVFATISGFGMMSQITISNTLIQTTVDPAMRGRVISFYAMAFFGMQPLGGLLVGGVSQWIGTPDTVLLEGFIALIIGFFLFRKLRKEEIKNTKIMEPITELTLEKV
ncbi:MFS transporter [Pedobacter mucosus]|nr:MFS transporter [Pedobacter mucosus]UKT63944.1 MFS transporter [Pedobacter mucosus]